MTDSLAPGVSRDDPHASRGGARAEAARAGTPIERPVVLRTGAAGLDDILGGGLPAGHFYLVEGAPGSGKTTLALQFLLEGRDCGEAGLYVTLSETASELETVARSHGWSLAGIDMLDIGVAADVLMPDAQYTVFHPSEVELQDTTDALFKRVEEVKPARVVLDSVSELQLLARDPLRFRRQVLALKQFFTARGITVLLLDDQTATASDPQLTQLQSLAHGVIRLEQLALAHGAERRQLRVMKLRGVRFHAGYHDFAIRTGGLDVFPRVRLGGQVASTRLTTVASGSPQVDALLGGGVAGGTSLLLTGPPGTGKSVLATEFAISAAERGESVDVHLFDEREGTFRARAVGLGMELDAHLASRRIRLHPIEPTEISPGEFIDRVIRGVDERDVRLVVIDSLNGFLKAMPEERQLVIKIHELLSYLHVRGVTTVLTLAQRGVFGHPSEDAADISYLADTVILLRYFEASGEVRQAISVVKKRTGNHERTIREARIERGGLALGEPLREFQGVLTGVPTYTGERRALMKDRDAARSAGAKPGVDDGDVS